MNNRQRLVYVSLLLLPLVTLLVSLCIGTYHISVGDVFRTLVSAVSPSLAGHIPLVYRDIIFQIRLPRLLLALLVGASLSVSGASLQALFRNVLVNEYILGISFGAGFGAALSMVFLGQSVPTPLAAFVFAVAAVALVVLITGRAGGHPFSLLLTGIIVSSLFSALLTLVQFFASPYSLQSLFFWLMGSLSLARWNDLILACPLMAGGILILILLRWRFNVLSLGDEEAQTLGVRLRNEKGLAIFAATLCTASATAVAGIVGWVGLIVPHLVRLIIGVDNRRVIPLSASLGAVFLILADDFTRMVASFEIPLGIFTSLIGIPLFAILFRRSKGLWL